MQFVAASAFGQVANLSGLLWRGDLINFPRATATTPVLARRHRAHLLPGPIQRSKEAFK
jgi:hypothetical protein